MAARTAGSGDSDRGPDQAARAFVHFELVVLASGSVPGKPEGVRLAWRFLTRSDTQNVNWLWAHLPWPHVSSNRWHYYYVIIISSMPCISLCLRSRSSTLRISSAVPMLPRCALVVVVATGASQMCRTGEAGWVPSAREPLPRPAFSAAGET